MSDAGAAGAFLHGVWNIPWVVKRGPKDHLIGRYELSLSGCGMCMQVLSQWMPIEEEPTGRGAWGRRRTPQVAASVLLLIDSHPLVLGHMVRPFCCAAPSGPSTSAALR